MQVQLTYSTDKGEKYSFHISFPEGCGLDVDDCSVDISEDNVVLLLKKDMPETGDDHQWKNFFAGLNSSRTTVSQIFWALGPIVSINMSLGETLSDSFQCGECAAKIG